MPAVFSAPYVHIHVDAKTGVLETEWLDFANSQQLREALDKALEIGREHQVTGWIGNNRKMRTIRPTDQDWINQVWFPAFAELGVKRLAVVISEDALNQMGIANIVTRASAHTPHDTQYFADVDAARRWAGFLE